MTRENIERLINRYDNGQATEEEVRALEELLAAGIISPREFTSLAAIDDELQRLETPLPPASLDREFYRMLAREKRANGKSRWKLSFARPGLAPKFAFASFTLVLGFLAGYFLHTPTAGGPQQIQALSQQVSHLQEMMMLSLLEKGSATERLKAVNLSREMSDASRKVTDALLQTLNEDDNVNVRLAALEALTPYTADKHVREALVRSIGRQESPLVQVSMAELMVAMQERSAVKEFQKIMESDKTPAPVKEKIRESIDILI